MAEEQLNNDKQRKNNTIKDHISDFTKMSYKEPQKEPNHSLPSTKSMQNQVQQNQTNTLTINKIENEKNNPEINDLQQNLSTGAKTSKQNSNALFHPTSPLNSEILPSLQVSTHLDQISFHHIPSNRQQPVQDLPSSASSDDIQQSTISPRDFTQKRSSGYSDISQVDNPNMPKQNKNVSVLSRNELICELVRERETTNKVLPRYTSSLVVESPNSDCLSYQVSSQRIQHRQSEVTTELISEHTLPIPVSHPRPLIVELPAHNDQLTQSHQRLLSTDLFQTTPFTDRSLSPARLNDLLPVPQQRGSRELQSRVRRELQVEPVSFADASLPNAPLNNLLPELLSPANLDEIMPFLEEPIPPIGLPSQQDLAPVELSRRLPWSQEQMHRSLSQEQRQPPNVSQSQANPAPDLLSAVVDQLPQGLGNQRRRRLASRNPRARRTARPNVPLNTLDPNQVDYTAFGAMFLACGDQPELSESEEEEEEEDGVEYESGEEINNPHYAANPEDADNELDSDDANEYSVSQSSLPVFQLLDRRNPVATSGEDSDSGNTDRVAPPVVPGMDSLVVSGGANSSRNRRQDDTTRASGVGMMDVLVVTRSQMATIAKGNVRIVTATGREINHTVRRAGIQTDVDVATQIAESVESVDSEAAISQANSEISVVSDPSATPLISEFLNLQHASPSMLLSKAQPDPTCEEKVLGSIKSLARVPGIMKKQIGEVTKEAKSSEMEEEFTAATLLNLDTLTEEVIQNIDSIPIFLSYEEKVAVPNNVHLVAKETFASVSEKKVTKFEATPNSKEANAKSCFLIPNDQKRTSMKNSSESRRDSHHENRGILDIRKVPGPRNIESSEISIGKTRPICTECKTLITLSGDKDSNGTTTKERVIEQVTSRNEQLNVREITHDPVYDCLSQIGPRLLPNNSTASTTYPSTSSSEIAREDLFRSITLANTMANRASALRMNTCPSVKVDKYTPRTRTTLEVVDAVAMKLRRTEANQPTSTTGGGGSRRRHEKTMYPKHLRTHHVTRNSNRSTSRNSSNQVAGSSTNNQKKDKQVNNLNDKNQISKDSGKMVCDIKPSDLRQKTVLGRSLNCTSDEESEYETK